MSNGLSLALVQMASYGVEGICLCGRIKTYSPGSYENICFFLSYQVSQLLFFFFNERGAEFFISFWIAVHLGDNASQGLLLYKQPTLTVLKIYEGRKVESMNDKERMWPPSDPFVIKFDTPISHFSVVWFLACSMIGTVLRILRFVLLLLYSKITSVKHISSKFRGFFVQQQ